MLENQDTAFDRFQTACIELIGGHTPRHGLEAEELRHPPAHYDIECAIGDILDILEGLSKDTVMEDDLIDIAAGMVTSLHYVLARIERKQDDVQSEIRRLTREFDGSEIKDVQLQQQTNLMHQTDRRAEGLETMRDIMAEFIHGRYDHRWHPPRGNHISERRPISAAVIEARDFVKARKDQKRDALTPDGTLVGFAGGRDFNDHAAIWQVLDRTHARHNDMVLVHGGAKVGAEQIAAKWADHRGVTQIKCTPDWKAHAKAAPFKRNDEMLKLDLIGLIACPGNGITDNLIDKAKQKRLSVKIVS